MTDREKLIAMMDAAREYADFECDKRDGCSCCPNDSRNEFCLTPYMVDHLISNGVTFATDNNVGGKTNADRIRAMSDEELAGELIAYRDDWDDYETHVGCFDEWEDALKAEVDWLKQPVKDGEGE